MTVKELRIENIKKLEALTVIPAGSMIILVGENGAGKSSAVDALWMALGGKRAIPPDPVRRGAAKGIVSLDLGD